MVRPNERRARKKSTPLQPSQQTGLISGTSNSKVIGTPIEPYVIYRMRLFDLGVRADPGEGVPPESYQLCDAASDHDRDQGRGFM